jgi:hypothetical protein
MPFQKKDKRINRNGRPKGIENKLNSELREKINDFLNDNWENIQNDFDSLETKEKLMFFEKLLQYSLPRLKNVEMSQPNKIQQIKGITFNE